MSGLCRSVQVGRSRCSRCCHLFSDLPFHRKDGSWARALTQSPELGVWLKSSPLTRVFLSYAAVAIIGLLLCKGS